MSRSNEVAYKSNSWGVRLLSYSRGVTNNAVLWLAFVSVLVSFIVSILSCDENWFAASGGLCVAIGLAIFSELIIAVEEVEVQSEINLKISIKSNELPENPIEHIANIVKTYSKNRWRYLMALQVSIIGTLIWAYGFTIKYLPCVT